MIKKGDSFECINTVVMDDGEIAYVRGYVYHSERDDCITDNSGDDSHNWYRQDFDKYFNATNKIDKTELVTSIDTPKLFRTRSVYTQEKDTWSYSEKEHQSISLEKIESGNGHYFILKSKRWAFDDLKELTDLIERFDKSK